MLKLEEEDDYQLAVRMLEGYFCPKSNVVFERHSFFMETMHATETTASYFVRLRNLAKTCKFDEYNAEQAIRDQAVRHCQDKSLHTRFLKEDHLTLESLSKLAAAHEQAHLHARAIEYVDVRGDNTSHVNAILETTSDFATKLAQMQEINRLKTQSLDHITDKSVGAVAVGNTCKILSVLLGGNRAISVRNRIISSPSVHSS